AFSSCGESMICSRCSRVKPRPPFAFFMDGPHLGKARKLVTVGIYTTYSFLARRYFTCELAFEAWNDFSSFALECLRFSMSSSECTLTERRRNWQSCVHTMPAARPPNLSPPSCGRWPKSIAPKL